MFPSGNDSPLLSMSSQTLSSPGIEGQGLTRGGKPGIPGHLLHICCWNLTIGVDWMMRSGSNSHPSSESVVLVEEEVGETVIGREGAYKAGVPLSNPSSN